MFINDSIKRTGSMFVTWLKTIGTLETKTTATITVLVVKKEEKKNR